jgi:hypothetical protein
MKKKKKGTGNFWWLNHNYNHSITDLKGKKEERERKTNRP